MKREKKMKSKFRGRFTHSFKVTKTVKKILKR